ncbi:MAG TPA: sulfite exporter TauE/SafE family protein [Symbiobacteriaceae bacterium]|nr:sulfite exporter TauE/SafE family protein [Symbiobacteriaceae bacterium]
MVPLGLTLAGIGLAGSFVSGLLGVGGAAFIIPMLYYIPKWLGTGDLNMKECAGLSIVLVLVGSLSGAIAHRGRSASCPQITRIMAPATAIGALVGGLGSRWVPVAFLTGLFATLALLAGLLMFRPGTPGGDEVPAGRTITFPERTGALIALGVGLVAGLVGAGGAFILVPLMIYVLKIPTRVAMSSSLSVVFVSSIAGFIGKVAAGQIPWALALVLVAGAVPGARWGAHLAARVKALFLRYGLAAITTLVAARMWADLLY